MPVTSVWQLSDPIYHLPQAYTSTISLPDLPPAVQSVQSRAFLSVFLAAMCGHGVGAVYSCWAASLIHFKRYEFYRNFVYLLILFCYQIYGNVILLKFCFRFA